MFGFGAITYAKHPEGVIEARTRASIERIMRRRGPPEPPDDDSNDPSVDSDRSAPDDRVAGTAAGVIS